ncbi:MAG TPA: hypothetical protein VNW99_08045 [Cytophagaceae bacterium]|jgi:hypothetical protein|nr:hypothetical protein [Cytophagaceae bacterium]
MVKFNENFTAHLQSAFLKALIVLSIFVFSDCKRSTKNDNFFGPAYRVAPANFSVAGNSFTPNKGSNPVAGVNFNTPDSISFHATFSDSVSWTITLTQATTGAMKVITGLSKSIDQTNAVWNCSSSNIYFFRRSFTTGSDPVKAVISFLGSDITLSTTVYIYNVFIYNGKTINGVKYTLLDDFDGGGVSTYALTGSVYPDPGDANVVLGFDSVNKVESGPSTGNSYRMKGTDSNNNSYLGGMNTITLDALSGIVAVTDPNDLYINLYIYGSGKANSALEVKVYELDTVRGGTYTQYNNDGWINDIIIDWTGWKLVSLKYSNFQRARDPLFGGAGNGIKQPDKLCGMAVSLLSQPVVGADVDLNFDYVILSQHGPFTPR